MAGKKKVESAATRVATNLADLMIQPINVEIEIPGGKGDVLAIPVKILSFAEYARIEREVPTPQPKILAGAKGAYADTNDPEYIKARAEWSNEVMYRRILAAVEIDIPGDTIEERVQNLKESVSTPIMNQLIVALTQTHFGGMARVVARADTFQPNGHSDQPDFESLPETA